MRHVDTTTTPLTLHPFTVADAERMLSGEVDPRDGWEGGYAFTDEPELLSEYVRAVRENGDPAPFGPYLVRRAHDGATIGGVNLFGPPDDEGAVEFAFGLVPAVRGQGLALHAVLEAVELARTARVPRPLAPTARSRTCPRAARSRTPGSPRWAAPATRSPTRSGSDDGADAAASATRRIGCATRAGAPAPR